MTTSPDRQPEPVNGCSPADQAHQAARLLMDLAPIVTRLQAQAEALEPLLGRGAALSVTDTILELDTTLARARRAAFMSIDEHQDELDRLREVLDSYAADARMFQEAHDALLDATMAGEAGNPAVRNLIAVLDELSGSSDDVVASRSREALDTYRATLEVPTPQPDTDDEPPVIR